MPPGYLTIIYYLPWSRPLSRPGGGRIAGRMTGSRRAAQRCRRLRLTRQRRVARPIRLRATRADGRRVRPLLPGLPVRGRWREGFAEVPPGILGTAGDASHRDGSGDDHVGQHVITGGAGPFPPVPAVHADQGCRRLPGLLGQVEQPDLVRDLAMVSVQAPICSHICSSVLVARRFPWPGVDPAGAGGAVAWSGAGLCKLGSATSPDRMLSGRRSGPTSQSSSWSSVKFPELPGMPAGRVQRDVRAGVRAPILGACLAGLDSGRHPGGGRGRGRSW